VKKLCNLVFVLVFAVFGLSSVTIAEDYLFDGVYVQAISQEGDTPTGYARLQLKCGLSFLLSHRDGSFEDYYLDVEAFLKEARISYVKSGEGKCTFDKVNQLEQCNSTFYYDGKPSEVLMSFNHYTELTPMKLRMDLFDSLESFKTWKAKGSPKPFDSVVLHRCLDMTESAIAAHLNNEPNKLSQAETFTRKYYGIAPNAAARELAKRVISKLRN
jgi:hypothetical protein